MSGSTIVKRFFAYLIDLFVIMLIPIAISNVEALNPRYEEYQKYEEEYIKLSEDMDDNKVTMEEFISKTRELSYDLNRNNYVYLASTIIVILLYFGLFPFITKGQTLGKRLLNLKIVHKKEGKEVKIYQYLIRTFILCGLLTSILTFIGIWFNRDVYNILTNIGSNIDTIISIIIVLMILFYKEGMGLHDVIAGTKVIDLKQPKEIKED